MDVVDNSRMIRQYKQYGSEIKKVIDTRDAVEQLEAVYNKRQKTQGFFVDEYRKMANDRCSGRPGGKK